MAAQPATLRYVAHGQPAARFSNAGQGQRNKGRHVCTAIYLDVRLPPIADTDVADAGRWPAISAAGCDVDSQVRLARLSVA
jgi:hypothetical protein